MYIPTHNVYSTRTYCGFIIDVKCVFVGKSIVIFTYIVTYYNIIAGINNYYNLRWLCALADTEYYVSTYFVDIKLLDTQNLCVDSIPV